MNEVSPFTHLLELERRCRRYATGLPQKIEVKKTWMGIGYKVAGRFVLSELGEIREILDYPPVTKLPTSKVWFHGVANIRGALIPVVDLQGFLGQQPIIPGRRSKIMRIQMGSVEAALLAPEILGMKRFVEEDIRQIAGNEYDGEIQRFVTSKFETEEGNQWGVFSMQVLSQDQSFFDILQ
jgi:twitching motility protein PilI